MAEATDLKSVQCRFESDRGYFFKRLGVHALHNPEMFTLGTKLRLG